MARLWIFRLWVVACIVAGFMIGKAYAQPINTNFDLSGVPVPPTSTANPVRSTPTSVEDARAIVSAAEKARTRAQISELGLPELWEGMLNCYTSGAERASASIWTTVSRATASCDRIAVVAAAMVCSMTTDPLLSANCLQYVKKDDSQKWATLRMALGITGGVMAVDKISGLLLGLGAQNAGIAGQALANPVRPEVVIPPQPQVFAPDADGVLGGIGGGQ